MTFLPASLRSRVRPPRRSSNNNGTSDPPLPSRMEYEVQLRFGPKMGSR